MLWLWKGGWGAATHEGNREVAVGARRKGEVGGREVVGRRGDEPRGGVARPGAAHVVPARAWRKRAAGGWGVGV